MDAPILPLQDKLTDHCLERIWLWNSTVPETIEKCVHDLFSEQAKALPDATAVCAWDGEMTYGELDALSSRLAGHLVQLGLESEDMVPLCFEKSMWTVVAMLAVLKAGGAFVPLDPNHPASRHEEIFRQTGAKVALTSAQHSALWASSDRAVFPVSKESISQLPALVNNSSLSAKPTNAAYVMFTSGSTGVQKGVVLEHQAVATSCLGHGQAFGITDLSRVLQFASYTFDACITEIITTLLCGGCICVPSDSDRRDNLAKAINAMNVNWALLTPSVARTLNPNLLPSLKILVLGGEQVNSADWDRWPGRIQTINAYGPTECAVCCNAYASKQSFKSSTIGTSIASVSWVVDSENHHKLAPLGSVGELLVEGPILARGYLNDADKTAAAFIDDPAWLVEGFGSQAGRKGRLYKTGDLVRYDSDGNLVCLGRKDGQIKVRGQRVELGEVEHHLRQCMPMVNDVIVEIITPDASHDKAVLVAFVCVEKANHTELHVTVQDEEESPRFTAMVESAEVNLRQYLPNHMIPSLYLPINQIPMTTSGKIDRKQLQTLGSSFSIQQLARMQGECNGIKRQPETEMEYTLQRVWAQVLNMRPDEIGRDDSIFRLGGDSISAMQVVSLCRTKGITLTTQNVMKGKDIRGLAKLAKSAQSSAADSESLAIEQAGLPFELSPIQQMYIQAFPGRDECFDQCFYLRLNKPVSPNAMACALETVVQQHAMLRARIKQQADGTWRQIITDDIQGSLQWRHHRLVNDDAVGGIIAGSRKSLHFEQGPILAADLFSINDDQTLFITINHLFVDLVSWRIILQDIEQLVVTGIMSSLPTIPFQSWCQLQRTYARHHLTPKSVLPFEIKPPMISYWGIDDHWGTWSDTVKHEFTLDARTTASLLGECNEGLRTEPVELFIAGLIQSFRHVFQDRDIPTVFSEGHGRESWDDNIDLSRTVGWFTTLFPINCATTSTGNIKDTIRRTKDSRRSLPHKGWGYFASRFHNPEGIEAFKQQSPLEVLVNYQGLYQQLERQDTLFQRSDAPGDQDLDVSLQGGRFAVFVVSIVVQEGKAMVSFMYNRKAKHQDRIAHWIQKYETTMQDIVVVMQNDDRTYTLSDFPMVFHDYRNLDRFVEETLPSLGISNAEDVENIYPCSPMQQAILVNRMHHPANYWIRSSFKVVRAAKGSAISISQLQRAWQVVVERHTALRTTFAMDFPGTSGPVQIVLKNRKAGLKHVKVGLASTTTDLFQNHENVTKAQRHGLEHHLTIYELPDGTVFCILEISHAIVDGHSFAIIYRDFSAAYSNSRELEAPPPYSKFITFIQQKDSNESVEYWKHYLDGVEPCFFPSLPVSPSRVDERNDILKTTVRFEGLPALRSFCNKHELTPFTVIQLAWALVLGTFSNNTSPCFGYLSSGRQLPIDLIDSIVGPTINMLTCRINIQSSCGILEALQKLQTDVTESSDHQSCSLAHVQHALKLVERRLFNTAMTYQRHDSRNTSHSENFTIQRCDEHDPSEYDLAVHVDEYEGSLDIACGYQASRISSFQAKSVADTISHTILAIIGSPEGSLGDIKLIPKSGLKQLSQWNANVVPAVDRCVHDLFAEQAKARPNAPAICAWDGELTYSELDTLSSRLAGHLVQLGVRPESLVLLCFEKSMWTVVAMLAVLKAGGAFVPLDPYHPASRHEEIFRQTGAEIVLVSAQQSTLSIFSGRRVVLVSEGSISQLPAVLDAANHSVQPGNAAYIIFTSGSTGRPKGVVIEHRAILTSCLGHGEALEFSTSTRALQFASYTFDACIAEIITTLVYGGCICVPSDSDRRDLAKAINAMDINWTFLTPSVARLLDPSMVPSLKILVLGGEQVSGVDWDRWPDSVQTINGYGPTECCVFCVGYTSKQGFESGTIGTSVASVSWVVDPENHDRLVPLGSVGELLVEGPILARGYLNDADKTAAAFINDPAWLVQRCGDYNGRQGRLYKTGDLVRYNADGNLVYLGRKDNQVKIRGQRVELDEVEHHVRECLPGAKQLAVEVIITEGKGGHVLAVFVQLDDDTRDALLVNKDAGDDLAARVVFLAEVEEELAKRLPEHMVPTVFFAVQTFPMTMSGKTDRKRLREIGASFTAQQLAEMRTSSQGPKRQPLTEAERTMQQLWARVLGIGADSIGLDDSFFRLGGDSIAAMKLVGEARRTGLQLSATNIFRYPRLVDLTAGLQTNPCSDTAEEVRAFSLLGEKVDTTQVCKEIAITYNVDASLIEDVYPCSPLQEGLMSLTAKRTGDYIMQSVLALQADVDEHAFCAAWQHVARLTAALRTRIVQHSELGLLQVVVAEDMQWTESNELEEYLNEDKAVSMELGDPLVRYALVKEPCGGKRWFAWTIHHALYDGWSLPQILQAVKQVYSGETLARQPSFNAFIQYIGQQDPDAATLYWQTALADCEAPLFPPLPSTVAQPVADTTVKYQCPPLTQATLGVTTSTLIRAAWALVTSCYTRTDDVLFGTTVTGRNAPIAGIEAMVGPTVATVPVRVCLQKYQTASTFLEALQQQATEIIPYEQTGLQRIAKMGPGARHACDFQTLLVVQPADDKLGNDDILGEWHSRSELQDFTTYALVVQCTLAAQGTHVTASFDARVIERWVVEKMLRQLSFVMQQLAKASADSKVADIDTTTPEDKQQMWTWNADVPLVVERCVHDLFSEQAKARPNAPAICAWDGEMTYGELDALSSQLAGHLVQLRIKREDVVPLCFEKSMWTVVAMLAVLKAGGAFVPLDPNHPASQHKEIFKQTGAEVVLVSAQQSTLFTSLGRRLVAVSEASISQLPLVAATAKPSVKPRNAAYIIFTSGSTGIPKGVVLEHRAVATSCLGHGRAFGYTNHVRVLQFASYTFDACIAEIITTLVYGGCICVPSDNNRRDDLPKAINIMHVNCALLTPSVARLLEPSVVQSLEVLVLQGEQVSSADWDRWPSSVRKINGYGPAECSVCCNIYMNKQAFTSNTIGTAVASASWVVDPENHHRLAPLGSIGELLVEGPILARGYLNDADKTAAAFINDPAWLVQGCRGYTGRRGRLYKTGDLVRYDSDGNLVYLGRKDSQVKVRGQRVELGEIEHHVRECLPEAKQLAVEVVMPLEESGRAMLAAFVQLDNHNCDAILVDRGADTDLVVRVVFLTEVEQELARRLPEHMVPTVFFALAHFPTTTSSKTDRRQLREIGASFTAQQLAEIRTSSQGPKRQPSTEPERTMQQLWARVLNIEPDSIGLDDSFFRLGGDSITAMQISSSARAFRLCVSTGDILKKKTIALIARDILPSTSTVPESALRDPVNNPFDLTPIQYLHLKLDPSGRSSFDQCYFLELRDRVQLQPLSTALAALVQRHSMLRARFCKEANGSWQQYISEHDSSALLVQHMHTRDAVEVAEAMHQSRSSLDIERGPVLAAVLCDTSECQSLFVAIHHLVVDLVSWRVLLEELEDLLLGQTLPPASPTPFQAWNTAQAKYIAEHVQFSVTTQVDLGPGQLSYWGLSPDDVLSGYALSEEFVLDSKTTSALLGSCNDAFSTRPVELMVAALVYSFATVFPDRKTPVIFNEIHGREAWDSSIDLTRTVGWFTSMCPVQAANGASCGVLDAIREIKDCMRSFHDNGWSYFASQFASASAAHAFTSLFPVEVMFNYQGLYQQLERKDSLFKSVPMLDKCEPALAKACPRFALFDISLVVEHGCAKVSFASDRRARHQDRIQEWIQRYMTTLVDMSLLLPNRSAEWTLSDLPLAFSSYTDLDRFRHNILPELGVCPEDVEDIFPCSAMQEGILTSQGKDIDAYWVCLVYETMPNQETSISLARLQQAWKDVVRRHPLLRTLLVDNVPGSTGTTNVVLKDPQSSISVFRTSESAATVELFRSRYNPAAQKQLGRLPHHLSICQTSDEKVYLCLDISHAIIDGHSRGILLHDLQKAYVTSLDLHSALFRDFVLYTKQQSQEEAGRYWAEYLDGVEPCHFSSLRESGDADDTFRTIEVPGINVSAIHAFCQVWEITPATIIQTAWALVLSRYTNSATPCFGNLSSGRDLPIENVKDIFGPLISMLPCRVRFHEQLTVLEALRAVQRDYASSLPYQTFPLASMHSLLELGTSALFDTVLSLQRIDNMGQRSSSGITLKMKAGLDPTEYNIAISADYSRDAIEIGMTFRAGCIDLEQATRLAGSFSQAIKAVIAEPGSCIQTLDILTCNEMQKIWVWNGDVPPAVDRCIHDLFAEQAKAHPNAPAICAWDGELTYSELDALSTNLAGHLIQIGVKLESFVPLCFEKSMWTVVAMLAVLKAGGAFVPLDPNHPVSRHEEIFRQTGAKVMLASAQYTMLFKSKDRTIITVNKNSCLFLPDQNRTVNQFVKPNNAAYVIFTSGSTGVPKGVVMEHRSIATSCLSHGRAFQFTHGVRVLQFAAYTFDVSIAEIFTTLLHLGSICVPSDHDRRNDLISAMNDLCVNWASLTPSVARLLDPRRLPLLKRLGLGGELVTPADWEKWAHVPQRMNTYGPTECCIHCTACPKSESFRSGTIGKSIASVSWVVDTTNYNRLAPLGSIGELLVEGPILARGYLNDTEKTEASFLDDPVWLVQGYGKHPGRRGRLYKTGDLVCYDADGNLVYVGRKDGQVKVRGQRVELGEIENGLYECMPMGTQVAVEVISPTGAEERAKKMVVAFLQLNDEARDVLLCGKVPDDDNSSAQVVFPAEVDEKLSKQLPGYMMPEVYFAVAQLPMTISGKTDRRRLREMGELFTAQQLAEMRTSSQGPKRHPLTEAERTMQQLWARVLGIGADSIGLDDSFFRLGGDSIAAMKLVVEARKQDVQLTVASIFQHPKLIDLIETSNGCALVPSEHTSAFALLGSEINTMKVREDVAAICSVDASIVEDVYPCSPLQEGLMSLTAKRAGDYIMQNVLELRNDMDEQVFRAAWEQVVTSSAVLRTRIVQHIKLGLLQAVIAEGVQWIEVDDLATYQAKDKSVTMGLGDPMARYALIKERDGERRWFVWTIHHALYDGWSLPRIIGAVEKAYQGAVVEEQTGFNAFIQHLCQQDQGEAVRYWQATFAGCEAAPFPPLPPAVEQPVADVMLEHQCPPLPKTTVFDATTSTLLRAAWAILAGNYSNSDDVVFGATVTGRNAPVAGIETILGPTIATVPVRVRFARDWTVSALLETVQQQATKMIPYEQTGLQRIAKMGVNAQRASSFQTLLVVQPAQDRASSDEVLGEWQNRSELQAFTTYALVIQCTLAADKIHITASFDARVMERWHVQKMLQQLDFVAQQLAEAGTKTTVAEIDTLTPEDRRKLWEWNGDVLPAVERCVHELFVKQARARPDALAICAWDGEITYGELDELSSRLAGFLAGLGVRPEDIVPLCFEKSMWTVVAMLAVLKAGGAFAPLDPEHPTSRHEEIFQQTRARVVLASEQHSKLWVDSARIVVVVSEAAMCELLDKTSETSATDRRMITHTKAQPGNPAYVLFTSGSTGKPKGVVIEHRAVSTSCLAHGAASSLNCDSRVLQFAAYTFDACMAEIVTTVLFGGCICVPSENDRRNNLAKTITRMGVTWTFLTPSVAKLLNPSEVPSLRAILLGGESVSSAEWKRWQGRIKPTNAYGPTECTVFCAMYSNDDDEFQLNTIGKSIASVSWVVDPSDHNKLAPLGSVGELLVEGPILARGYLNDTEKTAAAFIRDPPWLLEGCEQHPGRRGRLYKTGDLVYYSTDGNLVYVGRKDTQVKVRGQRVELGEIEHHVRECMPAAEQTAVEVIIPGNEKDKTTVAVFVQLEGEAATQDGSPARVFFPTEVDNQLSERLPSYMVPSVYFALAQLPMTTSDKTDRKKLREIGASFSAQQLAELRTQSQGSKRQPSTEKEQAMQQLWAQVLNIEPASIGLDDSFFRLGGDSITAMQVSSTARSLQISVTTSDILRHKTIASLAHCMSLNSVSSNLVMEDPMNTHFNLTPIQELYFRLESTGSACFDQCFFLELTSATNLESLRAAFGTLVQRHSMLRASFSQTAGGRWQQHISDRGNSSFTVDYVRCIDSKDVSQVIRQSRDCLDIQDGPVLAAVLCDQGQRQLLSIAIHHLVIDLVSWRVLLGELEDLLLSRKLPAVPAIPFQAWQALQAEHATKHKCLSGVAQDEVASGELLSYWGIEPGAIKHRGTVSKLFAIDEQTTSALLGSCNDAFQTRPVELMLAGLAYSFAGAFPDRAPPTIFNEGHGREPWDDSIDISRTVGWFTTISPVQVSSHIRGDLLEAVRHTKDGMRKFPDNGRSYFASRFADASTSNVFASMFPVEVLFNYQGVYQQLERTDSLFKTLPALDGCEPASVLEVPRFALFEVSVVIEKGCMLVTVTNDSKVKRQQHIANWIERYEMALVEMAALLQKKHKEWTLSDLPLAFKSYKDLDSFQNVTLAELGIQPKEVEDVFPCLPMQEGILISQSRDPDAYRVSSVFEVVPMQHSQISCTRLKQAWKAVVRRHSLLRALLVDNVPGSPGTMNVVLKDPQPSISFFRAAEDTATPAMFRAHQEISAQQDSGLQHRISICELDNGKVYLCLDINHAIFDAHSRGIILRDLQSAYGADLNPDGARFRDVVLYLTQQGNKESHAYWARYLDGVEPCLFPSIAEPQGVCHRDRTVCVPDIDANAVHTFCQTWDVTLATVIQTAWALVLSQYTGTTVPCFGNISSRRDLPVEDVAEIFGPLITTIACRVRLDEQQTVMDVLRAVQSDYTNSLPYQNFSLASVHSMLGLGASALFNTILSLRRIDGTMAVSNCEIDFHSQSASDPTEYDISIGAGYNRSMIEIGIRYQTRCIDQAQAANLAESLSQAICGIITKATSAIGDLQILSKKQQQQLWEWNGNVPLVVERCVHELFVEQARARPDAPAICAWDGEITYGELDELSSRLAGFLAGLGVGPEDIVPLCFEKSMWTVVAMLAVLKAGGAFAPLDPEHPASRHEEIFRQTGARVVLASVQHSTLWTNPNLRVVTVSKASTSQLPLAVATAKLLVEPKNAAYIIFTSGSTGMPKGVVLEHKAVATSCLGHGRAFGVTDLSRVLQFASYTFDACIAEIITTLLCGGCICVPSNSDRRDDLAKVITAMGVNWAFLTPSVARLLDPSLIPSLKILAIGGEQSSSTDWDRWLNDVQTIHVYGPTECCIFCTGHASPQGFKSGTSIGTSVASVSWVVDPENHHKLAPLGSIGELLVEGPILARGYLNDAKKTAAAFINDPVWLLEGCGGYTGRQGRLYKTGDLVRYDSDGNLIYLGRKDGQVKVRGQRVELGEVEHHVRECLPEAKQLVVEVIVLQDEKDRAMLAAFAQLDDDAQIQRLEGEAARDGLTVQVVFLARVEEELAERLPRHMVPTVFFALTHFPMTTSGKIDRKQLREIGASFTAQQLAEMRTASQGPKRKPLTKAERMMQQLWTRVLDIELDSIGLDDSFFRLGGDSITAMKLAGEARRTGLQLSVADVFRHPKLAALASQNTQQCSSTEQAVLPFSLLPPTMKDTIFSMAEPFGRTLPMGNIIDIVPASYMQKFYIENGVCAPQEAFNYFFLELGAAVDVQLLKTSCCTLLDHFSILRTHFVYFEEKLCQVVPRHQDLPFSTFQVDGPLAEESQAIHIRDRDQTSPLGLPTSFILVQTASGVNRLIIRLSHAQYDGVCLPVMLRTFATIYQQRPLYHNTAFHNYLAYSRNQHSASVSYWRNLLAGSHITNITSKFSPKARKDTILRPVKVERTICTPQLRVGLTMASLVSSAWAVVLSLISGEEDVVYGLVVAGRNSDLPGITEVMGPCVNFVPVRVQPYSTRTSAQLLQSVQDQYVSLGESDSMGLDDIVQHCTNWPAESEFDSIVQYQNIDEQPEIQFAGETAKLQWFNNPFAVPRQLAVLSHPRGNNLTITITGNTGILTDQCAEKLLAVLCDTIMQLSGNLEARLAVLKSSLPPCTWGNE